MPDSPFIPTKPVARKAKVLLLVHPSRALVIFHPFSSAFAVCNSSPAFYMKTVVFELRYSLPVIAEPDHLAFLFARPD